MQAVLYRNSIEKTSDLDRETGPLSLDLFYPKVSGKEMETWSHWLPTSINFEEASFVTFSEILGTLKNLNAPLEVVDEFLWSFKLELFNAYQIRTPVRIDSRDPLLLGRAGGIWYRIALWGESLLPLEQIKELVEESLEIRRRASRQHPWLLLFSGLGLMGSVFLLFLADFFRIDGYFFYEPSALAMVLVGVSFAMFGVALADTPENRQQTFLDRFRL